MDDLGPVEAVDRLGESTVIAIADAADEGLDAGLGQALGLPDADVLRTSIGVMHQAVAMNGPSLVKDLLQRIRDL